jgi:hypothetical protein
MSDLANARAAALGARTTHRSWLPDGRTSQLPNFIVIGAMKSGTTSLFNYLRAHPQVYMSPSKEVDFFAGQDNWARGLDWYRRQFDGAGSDAIAVGEASTSYSKYPEYQGVPERIFATLPDVRLIYLVRDPVERIRSHYQHRSLAGTERRPLEDAVLDDPRYVDCSRYALQIERYMRVFPRERLLIASCEDLRFRRAATVRRIYAFLDVDHRFVPAEIDREFYRTVERAEYPPFVWWLRRTMKRYPLVGKRAKGLVDHVLPASRGRVASRAGGTSEAASTAIPDDVRRRLAERLHDDVQRLYAYMPEGFDGWQIA